MLIIRRFIEYFFNLPVFHETEALAMEKFLALVYSIAAMSIAVGPIHFIPQNVYYGACAICVLFIFLQGGITSNGAFFALYFTMGVSALFCEWAVFKSIPRFGLFVMVTIVVSPFIVSDAALRFRAMVFRYMMIMTTVAVTISFFCYFLGINYMTSIKDFEGRVGIFGGLFIHSMLLGPAAMMSALVFFNAYQTKRDNLSIILFFISAAATILSSSRGAVISLAIPVAYSLFMMRNAEGTKKRIIWLLILVSTAAIPVSDRITAGLRQKQENNENKGSTFSSRQDKWDYRIAEFKSSPVWGVGFAAIDPESGDEYFKNGSIEPGSSHLAVLSMTGLLGFVPYIYILLFSFRAVRGDKDAPSRFARCLFIAFMVHGIVEGYALAGGSFLCLCYWMVIGQCVDYKKKEELGWINNENNDDYDDGDYNEDVEFIEQEENYSIYNG